MPSDFFFSLCVHDAFFFFSARQTEPQQFSGLRSWRMVFLKGTFLQEYPRGSARLHSGDIWQKWLRWDG